MNTPDSQLEFYAAWALADEEKNDVSHQEALYAAWDEAEEQQEAEYYAAWSAAESKVKDEHGYETRKKDGNQKREVSETCQESQK